MNKDIKIILAISFPFVLTIFVYCLDSFLFPFIPHEIGQSYSNGKDINLVACEWRSGFPDLGGTNLMSEILRYFIVFLPFSSLLIAILIELREKPIERIELDLTED
jgi:hypothetical protein